MHICRILAAIRSLFEFACPTIDGRLYGPRLIGLEGAFRHNMRPKTVNKVEGSESNGAWTIGQIIDYTGVLRQERSLFGGTTMAIIWLNRFNRDLISLRFPNYAHRLAVG